MFLVEDRTTIRESLVAAAESDEFITAAALVGSAATGSEDQWSDIDLALRLAPGLEPRDVLDAWTGRTYTAHGATAHLDVWSGKTLFRVFLLETTLQVDLSFWPSDDFAPRGGPFNLLFGSANPPPQPPTFDRTSTLSMAWLYALHARSSIARGRGHQALHMLNGMRDVLISVACARVGVAPDQVRGTDDLPADLRRQLASTVVRDLDPPELVRAFAALGRLLLTEARHQDEPMARSIEPVVAELVRSATDQVSSADCG